LLLQKDLKQSDIPSHQTVHNKIDTTYKHLITELGNEMQVCFDFLHVYNMLNPVADLCRKDLIDY
jgi:hypothetical protein